MSKWSEFYARHGERNFTPTFNTYLDALIADTSAEIPERVDAWIIRRSWGNHADQCENGKGVQLVQADCARELDVPRQAVNPVFKNRQRRGYIRIVGRGIYPVDEPQEVFSGSATFSFSSPNVETFLTNSEEEANKPEDESKPPLTFEEFITTVWAAQHPEEYLAYREIERQYKEFRMRLLNEWRIFLGMSERSMTNDVPGEDQNVGEVDNNLSERCNTNGAPSYKETIKPSIEVSECSSVVEQDHSLTVQNASPQTKTKSQDQDPVTAKVEALFGKFADADPVQASFAGLAQEFDIPKASVCRAIDAKVWEKQRKSYRIESPAALLGFVRTGLPGWIAQHHNDIEFDLKEIERAEIASAAPREPFSLAEQIRFDCEWVRECPNNVSTPQTIQKLTAMRDEPDLPEDLRMLIDETLDAAVSEPSAQAQKAGGSL